ncbi:MAG: amidohydrolase [Nitrospinaceae bacterium]|nr:MAG: amidohydrolase [Nitrospinaceae bacterium]
MKKIKSFLLLILITLAPSFTAAQEKIPESILLHAARVFDGDKFRTHTSVLVIDGKIAKIENRKSLEPQNAKIIDLGDATLLPGFIELHAHLAFQNIPAGIVLRHGITTIRDVGGAVHKPYGGQGSLRVLTSGPIITAPSGYPIPNLGSTNIALPVSSEEEARQAVRNLIKGGAVVIKVALEPGGETGAPWSNSHGHGHNNHSSEKHTNHHHSSPHNSLPMKPAWPLLPENIVKAIVDEAHKNNRKVTAHVAEKRGVQIAIDSDVDEWAHVPCEVIPKALLKKAVAQKVKIVTTFDTLSKCSGVAVNAASWTSLGGDFLYGAEIAHPDIPWGIDAQELIYMMQMAGMEWVDVFRAATSHAGRHLNWPLLGTLQPGAPADMIAVKGDPAHNLKILEYPDLVISGGKIVVNQF